MMQLDKLIVVSIKEYRVGTVIDVIMAILFVLFMIFVFGGYHKNKSAEREEQFRLDEERNKEEEKS